MPRKKIIDSNSCKFSLDVSGENKTVLDEITRVNNEKYGPTVNNIIRTLCLMPDNVKNAIQRTCLFEYDRLKNELSQTTDEYQRSKCEEEKECYAAILKLTNKGRYDLPDENRPATNPKMKSIELVNGYLIIPSDWIIVNPESSNKYRYAAVLECRNSKEYGVPHFVYLTDYKSSENYTKEMEQDFYDCCEKEWPEFSKIKELSDKNQLIPNPEKPNQYLNLEAYLKAPLIGIFAIPEQGERTGNNYPYDAKIVRTDIDEE